MNLRLYMTAVTEALGPGKRFAIWVQGCNRHCRGCIAPDTWDLDGGYEISVEELVSDILNTPNIEGITISGGEPFLQQESLCETIEIIRKHKDIGVIIYTGYSYGEISNTELASVADVVIDGKYIQEKNDDKSLRGSSNQNIICVTDRYRYIIDDFYGKEGRKIEVSFSNGEVKIIGIPNKSFLKMIGD